MSKLVDDRDPIRRAYRRYWCRLKAVCVVIAVGAIVFSVVGIPHLQTTYTYRPSSLGGIPSADQKLSAWYVSFTGWQHVELREYGQAGLPFIFFIPVYDCIDVDAVSDWIASFCEETP
jgi:hypothetical protein